MIRWTRCGFTLIELTIALAVVAILAAVAYPSYRDIVMRSRRMDAISSLLALRVAQEKWRANHATYAALTELGHADHSPDGHYRLRIVAPSAGGFVATATPIAGGAQQGDRCGSFAIDQRGPLLDDPYAGAACWSR